MDIPDQPNRASCSQERPFTSLPRQTTFKRQNSERRDRLCLNEPLPAERRAVSASRHASTNCVRRRRTRSSPPPSASYHSSTPNFTGYLEQPVSKPRSVDDYLAPSEDVSSYGMHLDSVFDYEVRSSRPISRASSVCFHDEDQQRQLQHELDTKWILNLSMHFRDKSDREKFFVTYAQTPTHWRRLTVSCDYRKAERGSLEWDLRELQFQRDKSFAIYEAIRESLPEIQFYDTVTNLKLETTDGRLHVHVTEDVNEIIQYPSKSMIRHILESEGDGWSPKEVHEKDLIFEAHLSGFVYRIRCEDRVYIKKEIPSPDTIDEFLYEINALHALQSSNHVIRLEAIVLDDAGQTVKGLLLSQAAQGAIVDLLYENRGRIPWEHREVWGRQAITGLRDIHEEGYVQGDFTLSNIVVDEHNNAQIIDINRRGCPVGWEPPEIAQKIASNQRISMYIGEKSDLYQLGMTLWALAMDDDEPERHDPPLLVDELPAHIPQYFKDIVRSCLAPQPRDRLSAKALVELFPAKLDENMTLLPQIHHVPVQPISSLPQIREPSTHRPETKQYIDPDDAVERDDLDRYREEELLSSPQSSKDDWTFTYPQSSQYDMESAASVFDREADDLAYVRYSPQAKPFGLREIASYYDEYLFAQQVPLPLSDDDVSTPQRTPTTSTDKEGLGITCDSGPMDMTSSLAVARAKKDIDFISPFQRPCRKSVSMGRLAIDDSKSNLMPDTLNSSPDISPFTTSLNLPRRPASARNSFSARSSDETMIACDAIAMRHVFPGATAREYSSSYDRTIRPPIGASTASHQQNSADEQHIEVAAHSEMSHSHSVAPSTGLCNFHEMTTM